MNAELKPCPFCGGPAVEYQDTWKTKQVCCGECDASADVPAWNRRAPQWQPIETAPSGKLVVVCWLDDEDVEHPERHEFDYIEDGMWVHHANLVEYAQAVAPSGSRIPKEQAPYQWWMPLPAPPEVK